MFSGRRTTCAAIAFHFRNPFARKEQRNRLSGRSSGSWINLSCTPSRLIIRQWFKCRSLHLQRRHRNGIAPFSLFSRSDHKSGRHLCRQSVYPSLSKITIRAKSLLFFLFLCPCDPAFGIFLKSRFATAATNRVGFPGMGHGACSQTAGYDAGFLAISFID